MDIGTSAFLGVILGMGTLVPDLVTILNKLEVKQSMHGLPPFRKRNAERLKERARKVLFQNGSPAFRPGLAAALSTALAGVMGFTGESIAAGGGFTFMVTVGMLAQRELRGPSWTRMREFAVKEALTQLPMAETEKLLIEAAASDRLSLRIAAIVALRLVPTAASAAVLERLQSHDHKEIARAAKESLEGIGPLIDQEHPMSVRRLESYLPPEKRIVSTPEPAIASEEPDVQLVREILYTQVKLVQAMPAVYCSMCWAWAEKCEANNIEWVRCRICGDTFDLQKGISQAAGHIGGNEPWALTDGKLVLNPWDHERQTARAADMDSLTIEGGYELNYDWAVSAVLAKQEVRGFPPGFTLPLIGKPEISDNVIRAMREFAPVEDDLSA